MMKGRQPLSSLISASLAMVALLLTGVRAQIYQFDKVDFPEPRTLHTMYVFYVYSYKEAPDRSSGKPLVKFHDIKAQAKPGAMTEGMSVDEYKGVQLSLLPYRDFWKLVDPNHFCSTARDVEGRLAAEPNQFFLSFEDGTTDKENTFSFTPRIGTTGKDVESPVHSTAVYMLIFSNCGDFTGATVTGSVMVKNPHGFLPGNEYHKMPFYGWLSLGYAALASIWMFLSFRWWKELFHIHYCIAVVILLGLVEAFVWWIFFNDWNSSGLRSSFLFVSAILMSVIKSTFSYILVLVASLGWGVTRPYLDSRTLLKVQAVTFLYITLDFIREAVLSFRHTHALSMVFVLLCLLPVAVLNGIIFYWIFTALSSLTETLRERKQADKLLLFERLTRVLVATLCAATLTLLFQIFDLSRSVSIRWHYQWFVSDGVAHVLFFAVLLAMMYLWAPHMNSQRFAYSQQLDTDDLDKDAEDPGIWDEDPDLDNEKGDDSLWASTHGKDSEKKAASSPTILAERVGATAAE